MKQFFIFIFILLGVSNVIAEDVQVLEAKPSDVVVQNAVQPASFADIVEPLIPVVVNIYTEYSVKSQRENIPPAFRDFKDLFKEFDVPFFFDDTYSNPKAVSLGSGFIIDADGYIVTNNHVVENADKINIKLHDNTELEAKLIGTDKKTDLALLKVDTDKKLPFAVLGDDQKTRVGDWVIAIGNPFGLNHTVTKGIVSSKARDIDSEDGVVNNYVQTDAPINRGNSGGPLFDLSGKVIGVNTAIYSSSGASAGVGFAIPSNTVQKVVFQLKKFGKVNRGLLNIVIQQLTPEIAEGLGVKEQKGVLVSEVSQGGAGDKAGLKPGDIIFELNGKKVNSPRELQVLVAETEVNSTVTLLVLRDKKVLELKTVISADVAEVQAAKNTDVNQKYLGDQFEINGVAFANLDSELARRYQIDTHQKGVLVNNVSKSSIWRAYLKSGDLVTSVNQQPINNISELEKAYSFNKDAKNIILFMVKRRNMSIFLALPVK